MQHAAFFPDQFERAWPEVARRVAAGLRARGVPADAAEEAVQEAAERALRAEPAVGSPDELARWAFTVARRVVIDTSRRRLAVAPLEDASGRAADVAVERAVLSRLDLDRAARALGTLRAADRAALLASLAGTAATAPRDRRQSVRDAVRLHRARARLADAFGRLGVAGGVLRRLRRLLPTAATGGAALVAAVVVVTSAPPPGHAAVPPARSGAAFGVAVPPVPPRSPAAPPPAHAVAPRARPAASLGAGSTPTAPAETATPVVLAVPVTSGGGGLVVSDDIPIPWDREPTAACLVRRGARSAAQCVATRR